MAIKVKAIERDVSFDKNNKKWAFVMQPELYSKLSATKVIQEAALRSGISKGAINAAWDAIGEVVKAWATEGHSVAIPGLGTMRFGIRAESVDDVNQVSSKFITSRRVIFTPSVDIKDELRRTAINITCYDRTGKIIKQVTSDTGDVEDPEQTPTTFTLSVSANPSEGGTVSGGGSYAQGAEATLTAIPASGYTFTRWSDGNTQATRTVTVSEDKTYTAVFAADGSSNTSGSSDSSGSSDAGNSSGTGDDRLDG